MISWQMWQGIRRGLKHPAIVRSILRCRVKPMGTLRPMSPLKRGAIVVFSIFLFGLFFLTDFSLHLIRLFSPLLTLVLLSPLLVGTFSSVSAGLSVIGDINRERQTRRYELITATPVGVYGLFWTLSHIVYNTAGGVEGIRKVFMAIYLFFLGGTALLGGYSSFIGVFSQSGGAFGALTFAILVTVLFVTLLLDLLHSTLVGLMVGMLVATFFSDGMAQRIIGGGAIFSVQIMTYIVLILVLRKLPDPELEIWALAIPVAFFGVREGILLLTGWLLARRLEISMGEMLQTMRQYP